MPEKYFSNNTSNQLDESFPISTGMVDSSNLEIKTIHNEDNEEGVNRAGNNILELALVQLAHLNQNNQITMTGGDMKYS